jgi:transcriptional regulator with XRE-family HTH domain/predicted nucleotidyltransferase
MKNVDFGMIVREIAAKQGISQVELAERSSVSRVQINRIFGGNTGSVRPETRQKIAAALGLDEASLSVMDVLQRYRKKMRERHLVKSLAGLGFAEFQRQPLNTFYVPPAGIDVSRPSHMQDGEPNACFGEPRGKKDAAPAIDLIKANRRIVILGVPGAGKTTLVQFLATEVATDGLDAMDLPIVVRLPEFALALTEQPDLTIFDWVVSQAEAMECVDIVEPLERQLCQSPGTVLALFDGLDEVPGSDIADNGNGRSGSLRSKVIEAIKAFVRRFPKQRYVITSRLSGFDESSWMELDFRKVELQEYGDEQIREAIQKWSTILSNSKHESADKIEKELTESIFENPRVRQLAGNPLILTILIVMCKARGYALPRRRVDLYEKVTEVFLDSWEKSKRKEHGFRETWNIDLDTRELRWLIAELALAMQRAGLVTAHRWWVIDHLHDTLCNRLGFDSLTAKKQADPILRFISTRAGLLDERLPSVFAFTHRTMQEYFAAIGLIEESNVDPIHAGLAQVMRPQIFHPEWSEVVRLVAAQVSPSPAEDLLKMVVDDGDPTGRLLCRGELLAIKCLADGATISDRNFIQGIFASLRKLGSSKWLGVTMEAFDVLRMLAGSRYDGIASETRASILTAARQELSEREYRMLVFSASGPHKFELTSLEDESKSPVLKRSIVAEEFEESHYFPNLPLFASDFEQWLKQAAAWLKKSSVDDDAKEAIVHQMRFATMIDDDAKHREAVFRLLLKVLDSKNSTEIRSAAARAIGSIDREQQVLTKELVATLTNRTEPPELRGACAIALESSAAWNQELQEVLIGILADESENVRVRKSAAYALEESAANSKNAATNLLSRASSEIERTISIAAIFALSSIVDQHLELFSSWVDERSYRTFAAARVLAGQILSGRLTWECRLAHKLEAILCSAGGASFEDWKPCPHILMEIKGLVDERERRGGLQRETVITESLRPLAERIRFAFVFGSVAKHDQHQSSDIDLMLIGNLSQREITQPVKKMQSVLGREVNPSIYSIDTFREKYRNGDPFALDVVNNPKIFVLTDNVTTTEKEFLYELRRLETQPLAEGFNSNIT